MGVMTDRKDLIVGNWKMNANHLEAIQMVQKLSYRLEHTDYERVEVVVAPPFTSLRSIQTVIEAERLQMGLGAQNVHWEDKGAYTGEVSPAMLAKLSVHHVIVGHSERRQLFGETDDVVNKKARAVLAAGMRPIICVPWPASIHWTWPSRRLPMSPSGRSGPAGPPRRTTPARWPR